MPLYRVERTVVAIVEAPDIHAAKRASFRSEWDAEVAAIHVDTLNDVPSEWRDYPPIDTLGRDVGAPLNVRLAAKESP
jgi:hypothetical protein